MVLVSFVALRPRHRGPGGECPAHRWRRCWRGALYGRESRGDHRV